MIDVGRKKNSWGVLVPFSEACQQIKERYVPLIGYNHPLVSKQEQDTEKLSPLQTRWTNIQLKKVGKNCSEVQTLAVLRFDELKTL